MKKAKKILFAIITSILVLLLAFNIYNFVCIKILKHDIATINGYALLEVVSGSMSPEINKGDMIIINTKDKNYQEKDIITYYDNKGNLITHRIVNINDLEIVTKGDSNNTEDEPIHKNEVIGKYVKKFKNLGRILSSFKSPLTMVMILIIGVLVCIFVSIDKDGNPILEEDEKEFQKFLIKKEKKEVNKKKKKSKQKINKKKV